MCKTECVQTSEVVLDIKRVFRLTGWAGSPAACLVQRVSFVYVKCQGTEARVPDLKHPAMLCHLLLGESNGAVQVRKEKQLFA